LRFPPPPTSCPRFSCKATSSSLGPSRTDIDDGVAEKGVLVREPRTQLVKARLDFDTHAYSAPRAETHSPSSIPESEQMKNTCVRTCVLLFSMRCAIASHLTPNNARMRTLSHAIESHLASNNAFMSCDLRSSPNLPKSSDRAFARNLCAIVSHACAYIYIYICAIRSHEYMSLTLRRCCICVVRAVSRTSCANVSHTSRRDLIARTLHV
jgi:hypothetical protein